MDCHRLLNPQGTVFKRYVCPYFMLINNHLLLYHSIARLETLLRDKMLPHVVKDVTTIYLPQDTVEIYPGEGLISRLKGTAFLIFSDANNALAACRALDGFPWLAW